MDLHILCQAPHSWRLSIIANASLHSRIGSRKILLHVTFVHSLVERLVNAALPGSAAGCTVQLDPAAVPRRPISIVAISRIRHALLVREAVLALQGF